MKSNHTQGEWKVEMLGKSYKVATDELLIADVHGFNEVDRQANARLIAAAPDMYEALKLLLAESRKHGESLEDTPIESLAAAALSKAEGNI